jgi:type III secretion system FlhB-like substrate exporter
MLYIKYDKVNRRAPIVVAKGMGHRRENPGNCQRGRHPGDRNIGLAQALMRVEVDDIIPKTYEP